MLNFKISTNLKFKNDLTLNISCVNLAHGNNDFNFGVPLFFKVMAFLLSKILSQKTTPSYLIKIPTFLRYLKTRILLTQK